MNNQVPMAFLLYKAFEATGHEIDWKGVETMEMEENWQRRKTKESWNIKFGKPNVNRDEGTLGKSYNIVIDDRGRK